MAAMTKTHRTVALVAGLLALALWPASAGAIDLNVGGIGVSVGTDDGKLSASVTAEAPSAAGDGGGLALDASVSATDGVSVGASAGGADGVAAGVTAAGHDQDIATANVKGGSANVSVGVSGQSGQPLTLSSDGGSITAGVNLDLGTGLLGGLLGGKLSLTPPPDGGGIGGWLGDGSGPGDLDVARVFARFDPRQQQLLVNRCLSILSSPSSFDLGLVDLCLALARLNGPVIR